jgi:hypothetical protein
MTITTTTSDAIELNNAGASLIDKGGYIQACQTLSEALRVVGDKEMSSTVSDTYDEIQPLHNSCETESDDEDDDSVKGHYVYRKTFFLSEKSTSSDLIGLAIIFNLAIAQHLLAKERNNSIERLRVALNLYELVYALQKKCSREESNFLSFHHVLGLVNNCGQIHKQLNREKKANRLFQHLLNSLMLMVEQGEEVPAEIEGFFATTSHLILKGPSVARAA